MIGFLSGEIKFLGEKYIILDVNGVGYKITSLQKELKNFKLSEKKEFWIYTNVKETEISLFGFLEKSYLDFYEILLGVSGVGPKVGMEILGGDLERIKSAILNKKVEVLTEIKGIGKKAGERIILELKNKIGDLNDKEIFDNFDKNILDEGKLALEGLGFSKAEISKKLKKAGDFESAEKMVEWFLKN